MRLIMENWKKYLAEQLSQAQLDAIDADMDDSRAEFNRMQQGPSPELKKKLDAAGLDYMEYDQWLDTFRYPDLRAAGRSSGEKRDQAIARAAQRAEDSLSALVRWKQTPISDWPTAEKGGIGKIKMTTNVNGKIFSWEGQSGDPSAPYWVKNLHRPWQKDKPTKKVTIPLNQYPEEIHDNIEADLKQILVRKAYSKSETQAKAKAPATQAPAAQTTQDKASPAPAPAQAKASPAPAQAAGPFAGDPSIKAWDKKWKGNPVADLSDDQEIMALKGRSRFRAAFKKARSAKAKFFHVPGFKYKVFNTGLEK